MSYSSPGFPAPTGTSQPPTGPGPTQYPPGSYPQGYYPPQITPVDRVALSKFFSLRWGEYPKPLPGPIPYTSDQLAEMFADSPGVKATVEGHMRNQGHTKLYLGREPTAADWADPVIFSGLALWFANGTGDDLSRGEDQIRQLVLQGMQSWEAASSGGIFDLPGTGGGAGGALTAGLPLILALGLGVFFLTRPTTKSAA